MWSSRFGQPFSEMASADIRNISNRDKALTIEEMQGLQEEFAKEAFEFLFDNAHIWIEYPKDFLISFTDLENGFVFTSDIAKAIITIAYFHRLEYRKRDQYPINFATDLSLYEDCVRTYVFPKTENYFYFFLAWVAFIFDLTMYCYKQGYDYTKRGEQFIAKYRDVQYFHSRGGFCSLIEYSMHMAVIYDNIKPIIISHELSDDKVIVPFIKHLDRIERQNRYSNNRWLLITPEMRYASLIRRKLSAKYAVVSSYDPRRVIPGYRVILKKSPTKLTQKIFPKYSKEQVSETQKVDFGEIDALVSDLTSRMDKTTISKECADDGDFPVSKFIVKKSPIKSSQKVSTKSKVLVSVTPKFDSDEKDDRVKDLTSRMKKTTISEEYSDDSDFPASKVIVKKSPTKSSQKVSSKSEILVSVEPKFDTDENDDLVKDLTSRMSKTAISEENEGDRDYPASKIEPSSSWDTDDSNSVFIIHKRFFNKRKASRRHSKYKRGLKIYSSSMNNDVLAMNLNKILDKNVDNRSYMEIGDCVYAVIPPGCFIDDDDTRIVVLDTSSEEEDYGCPKSFDEIADVIWSSYQEREATKSEFEKDELDLSDIDDIFSELECDSVCLDDTEPKESAVEISAHKTSELSNIAEAMSLESSNRILSGGKCIVSPTDIKSESKEVATEIFSEQRILGTSKNTETVLKEDVGTDVIWPGYLKPNGTADVVSEYLEIEPSKHIESESKESVSGMTTKQKSEQSKMSEAKSIESTNQLLDKEISTKISSEQRMLVSSKTSEAVSKESDIVVHSEHKTLVVTKSTGAIPKVRKNVLKISPRKGHHTDNASGDLEASVQNNNNELRQSYVNSIKSPKKD